MLNETNPESANALGQKPSSRPLPENDPATVAFDAVLEALRDPVFANLLTPTQDAETDDPARQSESPRRTLVRPDGKPMGKPVPKLEPRPSASIVARAEAAKSRTFGAPLKVAAGTQLPPPTAGRPMPSIVARAEAAKLRSGSSAFGAPIGAATRGPQLQPRQELTSGTPVKDTVEKIEPPSGAAPSLWAQFDVNWGQGSGVLFLLTTFGTGIGLATAMSPHRLEWVVALIVLLVGAAVTGFARPTLARHTNTAMVALAIMLVLALLPI